MSTDKRPEPRHDLLNPHTATESQNIGREQPRLSRSPHPYHRRSSSLVKDFTNDSATPVKTKWKEDDARQAGESSHTNSSRSTSDSENDGEDYSFKFTKALPAPPLPPRKGLIDGTDIQDGSFIPLHTPQVGIDHLPESSSYFDRRKEDKPKPIVSEHTDEALEKFRRRRLREYLRRSAEVVSLLLIGRVVLLDPATLESAMIMYRELLTFIVIILAIYALYPVRTFLGPLWFEGKFKLGRVHVPAAFDPAALLYPELLPVLIALSLPQSQSYSVMLNIVLGLSSLPGPLLPQLDPRAGDNVLHWAITCVPLAASHIDWPLFFTGHTESGQRAKRLHSLPGELLCLVFPLHQALVKILHHLTTTSLLFSEVQLLSIALINLLFLSRSPQAQILCILLWIGGLGFLIFCRQVLTWNVALERIPSLKFKRARQVVQASNILRGRHRHSVDISHLSGVGAGWQVEESSPKRRRTDHMTNSIHIISPSKNDALSNGSLGNGGIDFEPLKRWQTAPAEPDSLDVLSTAVPKSYKRRSSSSTANSYLTLTYAQIDRRKWMYSLYTFTVALCLVFFPIRMAVYATLGNQDPFSWAATYLFGQLRPFQDIIRTQHLQQYISLPPEPLQIPKSLRCASGWVENNRIWFIGEANTRLLLFGYWLATIAVGIACVLRLSDVAEVDTRRKVFHGMMVVMLLPTAYIDPPFLSLGLVLVLAVFLLLDLFRASQLRPLSKPLARFLTPYVDGRDLRGPVVVSHIFLLIGCAIPFWLSLGGISRSGLGQWEGWDVKSRDLSMVAGVVCVGMGDAAASLVGRRIGRRKWPWAGGKSLEGSAAFAAAVMVGLVFGKAWLKLGHWPTTYDDDDNESWITIIGKAGIAGASASFTEAVLTGCNDNVVVPIILWLLVRGLRL